MFKKLITLVALGVCLASAPSCSKTPAPKPSVSAACAILQPWSMNRAAVAAMDDQAVLWSEHYRNTYAVLCGSAP